MKMTQLKKLLSVILCIVLIAATALFTIGCSNEADGNEETKAENVEQPNLVDDDTEETTDDIGSQENSETDSDSDVKFLGEGAKKFDFTVVEFDGKETKFVIKTDKEIVGEALLELKLIEGEEGPYGLYVKKVNGIVADFDNDKTYWGFYVDGEYAMSGVDMTKIEEGKTYTFKVSK